MFLKQTLVFLLFVVCCSGQYTPSHYPPPGNYSFVGGALVQTQYTNTFSISVGVAYQLQVVATSNPLVQQWTMVVVSINPDGKKTLIVDTSTANFKSNTIVGSNNSYAGRLHYGDFVGGQSAFATQYFPDPTQLMITYYGSEQTAGVDVWKGGLYKTWTTLAFGKLQIESLWSLTEVNSAIFAAFAQGAQPLPKQTGVTHWHAFVQQLINPTQISE